MQPFCFAHLESYLLHFDFQSLSKQFSNTEETTFWSTTSSYPLSKTRCEIVEDEVGVGFWHSANVWDIMAHDHVAKGEIGSGAKRQVADYESI